MPKDAPRIKQSRKHSQLAFLDNWTETEVQTFRSLKAMYGPNFKAIATVMKSKSRKEVEQFAKYGDKPVKPPKPQKAKKERDTCKWTAEDHDKLMNAWIETDGNFKLAAAAVPHINYHTCHARIHCFGNGKLKCKPSPQWLAFYREK